MEPQVLQVLKEQPVLLVLQVVMALLVLLVLQDHKE